MTAQLTQRQSGHTGLSCGAGLDGLVSAEGLEAFVFRLGADEKEHNRHEDNEHSETEDTKCHTPAQRLDDGADNGREYHGTDAAASKSDAHGFAAVLDEPASEYDGDRHGGAEHAAGANHES